MVFEHAFLTQQLFPDRRRPQSGGHQVQQLPDGYGEAESGQDEVPAETPTRKLAEVGAGRRAAGG